VSCSRRDVCGLILSSGSLLVLSAACGGSKSLSGPTTFPPTEAGTLRLPLADYPALLEPGGWVRGIPPDRMAPVIVIHLGGSEYVVLAAACTHFGCGVIYEAGSSCLECPCHGSEFALDGGVLRGPAELPLAQYVVAVEADAVAIAIG